MCEEDIKKYESKDDTVSQRKWELYTEYRGRIRLCAYAAIFGVPAGALAILSTDLSQKVGFLQYTAFICAVVEIAFLFNLIVAINGAEKYNEENHTIRKDSGSGTKKILTPYDKLEKMGNFLGLLQAILFTAVATAELWFYSMIIISMACPEEVIVVVLIIMLLFFSLWYYIQIMKIIPETKDKSLCYRGTVKSWSVILASLITGILLFCYCQEQVDNINNSFEKHLKTEKTEKAETTKPDNHSNTPVPTPSIGFKELNILYLPNNNWNTGGLSASGLPTEPQIQP